jgi:hypothetical protein
MKLYSVFLPTGVAPPSMLERARFVKQGFALPAFVATPIWAARHRLWLALGLWLALVVMIGLLVGFARIGATAAALLYWLGALAFGLEADRFRQAGLSRAGFLMHGLALGASANEAEAIYFAQHADAPVVPEAPTGGGATDRKAGPPPGVPEFTDLLGLFPSRGS